MPRCFVCGHTLVWESDFMLTEIEPLDETLPDDVRRTFEDDDKLGHIYSCTHCGASYEAYERRPSERANYPFFQARREHKPGGAER